jgi:hypothetical protein
MNSIERHEFGFMLAILHGPDRGVSRMFYDWVKRNPPPEEVRYIEEVLDDSRDSGVVLLGRLLRLATSPL